MIWLQNGNDLWRSLRPIFIEGAATHGKPLDEEEAKLQALDLELIFNRLAHHPPFSDRSEVVLCIDEALRECRSLHANQVTTSRIASVVIDPIRSNRSPRS